MDATATLKKHRLKLQKPLKSGPRKALKVANEPRNFQTTKAKIL